MVSQMPVTSTLPPEKIAVADALHVRRRPWWRICLETIVFLLLAIVLVEGFFAICRVGQGEFLQPDREMGCVHIPDKLVTWRLEGYSNDYLSSVGLRDTEHPVAKAAGVYRIALLGDSATEGLQVSMPDTYGKALERLLNDSLSNKTYQIGNHKVSRFEVINFGCSSYSNGQELLQYRKDVLPYDVDAVVLLYNRGDTVENTLDFGKRNIAELRPYFYIDATGSLAIDHSVLEQNAGKLAKSPFWDFLRANSRIYGALSQMNMSLSLNESRYRKLRSWIDQLAKALAPHAEKNVVSLPQYPKQEPLNVTCALIAQFASETSAHHQFLSIIVFPNWVGDPVLHRQIAALKPFSQSLGVSFIDLTPVFFASKDLRGNFIEYHFSPQGHELAAQQLSDLFQKRLSKLP
jgi:GDSL-like Lipase/Acylhydrolase family